MDFLCTIVKGASFGIINVNPHSYSLTIKDPVTGVLGIIKDVKDAVLNDFDEGVWMGKRPLGDNIGVSSIALKAFNYDIMHYNVRIDGTSYSYKTQKGGTIRVVEENDNSNYEWNYLGKSQVTHSQISSFLDEINSICQSYNIICHNCQDFSDAFAKWARGIYNKKDFYFFGFPQTENTLELLASGTGVKLMSRLGFDIFGIIKK